MHDSLTFKHHASALSCRCVKQRSYLQHKGKSQSFMKRAQWSCGEVIGKEMGSGMAATSCSSWKHSRNIFGPMKHKGLLLYFPRGADSASLKSTVGPVEKIEGLEGSRQTLCIPAESHICQQDASSLSLSSLVPRPT